MLTDLHDRSPVEIDTRIAQLHNEITQCEALIERLTNQVLDYAGLRIRHPATWENRHVTWTVTGTFEEGVAILAAYQEAFLAWETAGYPSDNRPSAPSAYSCYDVDLLDIAVRRSCARDRRIELWSEENILESEFLRRRWSRYFLVTSSAGHIHSSTRCQTCRWSTQFGWMPGRSGQTESEAIEGLGSHAEALCSVCFPNAPVAGKSKVTRAKAAKLAAATFVMSGDITA